ncbi:MAG: glycoside hydrolase family 3 N-terminal domain-containing protein [Nitrospirota bacterium]
MKIPILRHAVAQMVMPRIEGKQLPDAAYRSAMAAFAEEGIGGFILFGGDIDSTPRYLAELQARAEFPLLISSDVERGLGQQLEGGTRFPSQRAVASAIGRRSKKDVELLGLMLDAVRTESRAAGIHIVFSPIMDVNNNPDNPIICTRSFGEDPETVEWFGRHYIRGLQKPGADGHRDLLACAKHFPGHGDTDQDSHSVLPVIRADRARLNRVELPPFREAVKDGVGTVMIAHLLVPALDPVKPVTFSKKVVTALLREGMAFEGLIVSDALDMGALAGEYPQDEIAIRAVEAGMDILLHPVDARVTIDAVVKAVEQGRLTETRIHESVDRIMAAKKQLGLFTTPLSPPLARGESKGGVLPRGEAKGGHAEKIDYERHRNTARELGRKAVTLLRGDKKKLPFDSGKSVACFVLDDDGQGMGVSFTQGLMKQFGTVSSTTLTPDVCDASLSSHLDLSGAGAVVIGIFSRISASKGRSGISPKLRDATFEILRRAKAAGKRSAVISFDSPYILDQFKDADVLIAGYDRMDAIQEAAAEMIAGRT